MQSKDITVRSYHPVLDIDGAYRAFVSGFKHSFWPAIDEADPELIRDIIRSISSFGNRNLVADAGGEAVGILAGCVGMSPGAVLSGLSVNAFRFFPKLVMNRYNASRKARKHLQLVFKNYTPLTVFKMPFFRPFCEVLLFTLERKYHGKGIGRIMMDEYVRRAREGGGRRVVVATDTTASWRFYPNYGFSRIISAPLRDCFSVSLPGEEVTGYIYSLQINEG